MQIFRFINIWEYHGDIMVISWEYLGYILPSFILVLLSYAENYLLSVSNVRDEKQMFTSILSIMLLCQKSINRNITIPELE